MSSTLFSSPEHAAYPPSLGARLAADGSCRFRVWAPFAGQVDLRLCDSPGRSLPMERHEKGYYELTVPGVEPGARYAYRMDGTKERPDPASRFQPGGVHAPSAVVSPDFAWTDASWHGLPLHRYVVYELHVGTFSQQGNFAGVIERLDELQDLGITAIELMPLAQFPGERNWGYDGAYPFAVQNSYGGPDGLRRLVDAAHARGLAIVLDVVFNHFGPEGSYFAEYGPYFTETYRTPWGAAINFDGPGSDEVRRFFFECALHWIETCHIDALRLDAVHAICDRSAQPFLQELAAAVRWEGERLNRRVYTIAESASNDPRLILPNELGGYGIDAQWCDDFHHALWTALTRERSGYYRDYRGFDDLVKSFRSGYVLDGRYSAFHQRRYGAPLREVERQRLFVFAQNHDQIGNRMLGERAAELVSYEQLKLAAALVLLAPFQPLLFMGEEYGETARFAYFVSHGDPELADRVLQGRRQEFADFLGEEVLPDPQHEETFLLSKLQPRLQDKSSHHTLRAFYQRLIALRKSEPLFAPSGRNRWEVQVPVPGRVLALRYHSPTRQLLTLFHFGNEPVQAAVQAGPGKWETSLDSAHACWEGPGSSLGRRWNGEASLSLSLAPWSAAVLRQAA